MTERQDRKRAELLVEELVRRSRKPLDLAKKTLLGEEIEYRKLRQAMEHYTEYWNDFTHPGSFSMACEAVGGNPNDSVRIQAAIAMMAAAFDLHDDIIDESKVKHGIPTVFGKFGKDIALLLGNAFSIEGFTLLVDSIKDFGKAKRDAIHRAIKNCLFEVGNAHACELRTREEAAVDPEEYLTIFRKKAASIEADFRIGAMVANGSNNEVDALACYGRNIGILTQLREEFIDMFELDELNQRIQNEYLPLPVLYAVQDNVSANRIQNLLSKTKLVSDDIGELVDAVYASKKTLDLLAVMQQYILQNLQIVERIRKGRINNLLSKLASSMLEDL
jgi:geranylgeranyl pyrophosphate synthase